jgi:hypothetical protein
MSREDLPWAFVAFTWILPIHSKASRGLGWQ